MKYLVLDTSSNFLYVGIFEDNLELYKNFTAGKNNHSEKLLAIIEEGLQATSLKVKDFDKIIIGIGPGSYTGLRVSMTVGKMFSWSLNIPLYTVSSLDLLASAYLSEDGLYAITNIAKKDHLYGKLIEVRVGEQKVIFDDIFLENDIFFEKIKNYQYTLINQENYAVNPIYLQSKKVTDIHNLAPNYLRSEL